MAKRAHKKKTTKQYIFTLIGLAVGAFLAALSIRVFLFPANLIDGGIVGISMIFCNYFKTPSLMPLYLLVLNAPFVYLSYKHIRKTFMLYMGLSLVLFAFFLYLLQGHEIDATKYDILEVIVIGGAFLGIGCGLMIRFGGCTDGTEILAIIASRKKGFTVGQVVIAINIFVFAAYGIIFQDWHIAIFSLLTYIVAFKLMDLVITGLDEMKSVMIISTQPEEVSRRIMLDLGIGLTIMHGKGGFSGKSRDVLFVIVERLDLAELKDIVLEADPAAFLAIENLHEVVTGKQANLVTKRKRKEIKDN